jgi:hypothetical protein
MHPLIEVLIAIFVAVTIGLLLRKPLLHFVQYFRNISVRKQWIGVGTVFIMLIIVILLFRM